MRWGFGRKEERLRLDRMEIAGQNFKGISCDYRR